MEASTDQVTDQVTGQAPAIRRPSRLGAWVRRNPIALKELRGRMRGGRAFIVLTVYVVLMGLFTSVLYMIYTASSTVSLNTTGSAVGKLIFAGVLVIELFLVCFVAPAFTAGAISGEREHRTFNLLRTTLLSARRIVLGKLLSALAYIVLLLLVAVPLQSLAFLMGGITVEEVVLSVELLLVTAITYGAVGIFFSTITRRTLTASILTYVFALLMTIAMPLASMVMLIFSPAGGGTIYGRPVLEAVMLYASGLITVLNPVATAVATEMMLQSHGMVFFFTETLSNGTAMPLIAPWMAYTVLYLVIALILVLLSIRYIRRQEAV
jgi:ABC-type transport system involved in multi-copper enzyme maturation permease subunit